MILLCRCSCFVPPGQVRRDDEEGGVEATYILQRVRVCISMLVMASRGSYFELKYRSVQKKGKKNQSDIYLA